MIAVLINAYACAPGMGSEPGMAWNWCIHLANHCTLHIITEGEFRDKIEEALAHLPQAKNMHFYYNPVSDKVRKMCWNQGDWRFYKHYRKWQRETRRMAGEIINRHHVEIIQHLNMVGFREPGYLWEINSHPFVWGPIGGLKRFPKAYLRGAGWKMNVFNRLKDAITTLQIKYGRRVGKAVAKADLLIASIPDSYRALQKYRHKESVIIPETGCYDNGKEENNIDRFADENFNMMWVGKFDFRKQLNIALQALAKVKHLKGITLSIYGTGSEQQEKYYRQMASELNIEKQVEWCGSIANQEIMTRMEQAQLFFFTSVSEDTSTVVLEALTCHLPVLCFDACGFGYVVDDSVGIKIPFSTPSRSIDAFAEKIAYLYHNRDVLKEKSRNCSRRKEIFSWKNKAEQMVRLYGQAIAHFQNREQ